MSRKTRSDAWGENLPEDVRWDIYALTKAPTQEQREAGRPWLRDYRADVLPYLRAAGLAAPGRSGWYLFIGRMREEEASRTIASVESSKRIAQGIVRANVDPKLAADMMTSLSVDAAAKGNDEAAKILADSAAKYHAAALGAEKLRLDEARQRTAEAQLQLAREKFEAAQRREDAAKAALGDTKLTDEDKIARMKEIFG
ncbi:MAG: hypothetical protein IJ678_03315 [Kiritimatiellae bacterium]|nr:hypothetical protein [Kiritimatiellia bacterium]